MPNPFNQLLAGLSGGFLGYGQQQQQQQQMARLNLQDQRESADSASKRALAQAQIQNYQSENAQRTAATAQATATAQARAKVNQRAFGAIQKIAPTNPLVQAGYDDATDYTAELKNVVSPPTQVVPTDKGLVRVPLSGPAGPVMGPDGTPYGKPAAAITPYQQAQLDLARQRLAQQTQALAAKAKQPTPDQVKSATVNDLAGPAADQLIGYHGGNGGAQQLAAAAAGHLPLVGHYVQGKVDPAFQNAMNAARTLATQYLEIMPKSRFQPSTVDDIMSQIAPNPSDAPQTRTAKLARVRVLKSAIAKRAALRPDDPGPTLDDVPDFPLPDDSN